MHGSFFASLKRGWIDEAQHKHPLTPPPPPTVVICAAKTASSPQLSTQTDSGRVGVGGGWGPVIVANLATLKKDNKTVDCPRTSGGAVVM